MTIWERAKMAADWIMPNWRPTGENRLPDGAVVNVISGEYQPGMDPRARSRDQLLRTSAVHAAVKLVATAIADLVCNTLYITDRDGRKVDPTPRQQDIIDMFRFNPNPFESGHAMIVAACADMLLDGNGLIGIQRSGQEVHALERLIPRDCKVGTNSLGEDYFAGPSGTDPGRGAQYNRSDLIHARYPDLNGETQSGTKKGFVVGPIYTLARTMALNGFLDEFVTQYFTSDANGIRMLFRSTGDLGKDDVLETRKYIKDLVAKGGGVPFIEHGLEYVPVNTAPANQDTAMQRQFQIDEIARIYQIPPALMGIVKAATNTAALNHEFWNRAVRPNVTALLAAMDMKLLNQRNMRGGNRLLFAVNPSEMLRGDPTSLAATYQCLGDAQRPGTLSPTEWRIANGYPAEMEWTESDDFIYEKLKDRQAGIAGQVRLGGKTGAEINNSEEDEDENSDG